MSGGVGIHLAPHPTEGRYHIGHNTQLCLVGRGATHAPIAWKGAMTA